jgi:hypothetical protein
MENALSEVRSYLELKYRTLYESADWHFAAHPDVNANSPSWIWQTSDFKPATEKEAANAIVLDPEIGICLYLIKFSQDIPIRNQIAKAISVQSQLLPTQSISPLESDAFGPWRVVVHWLVERRHLSNWISQAADLRQNTGHFEEVPADVVVRNGGTWYSACENHSFPRLLFSTRAVFRKEKRSEVDNWQSADRAVREALIGFEDGFSNPLASQCALRVVEISRQKVDERSIESTQGAQDLYSLSVSSFRNISKVHLDFRTVSEPVSATIIQGPNGSGKSSLYEALSLAVSGTSERHRSYLQDGNRHRWGRADRYVSDYLRDVSADVEPPQMSLNGDALAPLNLCRPEEVGDRLGKLSGAFFSQEQSPSLATLDARALGSEIAASFSSIAEDATRMVEANLATAQDEQREFNARWGLRANVTRRATVIEQIASKIVERSAPNLDGTVAWLNAVPREFVLSSQFFEVSAALSAWLGERDSICGSIAKNFDARTIDADVTPYLDKGHQVADRAAYLLETVRSNVTQWPEDLKNRVEKLGLWFQLRGARPSAQDPVVKLAIDQQLDVTQKLDAALRRGRLLSEQLKHLNASAGFFAQWSEVADDRCPTCETDLSNIGGLAHRVDALRSRLEPQLEALRTNFQMLRKEQVEIADRVEKLGHVISPFTPSEEGEVVSVIEWIFGSNVDVVQKLANDESRKSAIAIIDYLRAVPLPQRFSSPAQDIAAQIQKSVLDAVEEYERVSALPDAWKGVKAKLQSSLADVTSQHLPRTLQGLWWELSSNLMPAPWQYPGRVRFSVAPGRKTSEASIVVKGQGREALACHILNGAEIQNLALAWFITRFLTRGRFNYRFLVFDDPAPAMDQPTFRDFCRLLESVLRLNKRFRRVLTLVLFLHQDSRALDAARATDGVLYLLRWNRKTPISLERMRLRTESVISPDPSVIFS